MIIAKNAVGIPSPVEIIYFNYTNYEKCRLDF